MTNKAITNAKQVQAKVKKDTELEVSIKQTRLVMRKDLAMGYRMVKTVPMQGNSERCLVLR